MRISKNVHWTKKWLVEANLGPSLDFINNFRWSLCTSLVYLFSKRLWTRVVTFPITYQAILSELKELCCSTMFQSFWGGLVETIPQNTKKHRFKIKPTSPLTLKILLFQRHSQGPNQCSQFEQPRWTQLGRGFCHVVLVVHLVSLFANLFGCPSSDWSPGHFSVYGQSQILSSSYPFGVFGGHFQFADPHQLVLQYLRLLHVLNPLQNVLPQAVFDTWTHPLFGQFT